jgi:hypothetical protein
MKHLMKIIYGLMIMIVGFYPYVRWDFFRTQLIMGLKLIVGSFGLIIALIGFVIILIGLYERKSMKKTYNLDELFEENPIIEKEIIEEEVVEEKPVVKKKTTKKKTNSKKKPTAKKTTKK